jgi:hypothetical protein
MISTAIDVTGQTVGAALGGFHLCHSEDDEIQSIFKNLKKMGSQKNCSLSLYWFLLVLTLLMKSLNPIVLIPESEPRLNGFEI